MDKETIGYIARKALDAWRNVCQNNSMNRIIGELGKVYEGFMDPKIDNMKEKKNNKSIFTKSTQDGLLGKDKEMLGLLKNPEKEDSENIDDVEYVM